jgi:hypothetical protein
MHECSGGLVNQEAVEDLKLRKKEEENWVKPGDLAFIYGPEIGGVMGGVSLVTPYRWSFTPIVARSGPCLYTCSEASVCVIRGLWRRDFTRHTIIRGAQLTPIVALIRGFVWLIT